MAVTCSLAWHSATDGAESATATGLLMRMTSIWLSANDAKCADVIGKAELPDH